MGPARIRDQTLSPTLAGGFSTTEPPGKPHESLICKILAFHGFIKKGIKKICHSVCLLHEKCSCRERWQARQIIILAESLKNLWGRTWPESTGEVYTTESRRQLMERRIYSIVGLMMERDGFLQATPLPENSCSKANLKMFYLLQPASWRKWLILFVYNRAIIYCWKGPAKAKCSAENVLFLSRNRGYQSEPLKEVGLANELTLIPSPTCKDSNFPQEPLVL